MKKFLSALPLIAAPALAHADPVTITLITTALVTAAISTALSVGIALLTSVLFPPKLDGQNRSRTREFNPHPQFRFAFGKFPLEGSVVFHRVIGDKYYLVFLLNSLPSEEITKILIQEHTDLRIEDLGASLYDMQSLTNNPTASNVWNDNDFMVWIGRGDHVQAPQRWLNEGVVEATDTWSGVTVAFVRLEDGKSGGQAARFAFGKPPPLKFFGKWSKLYDPRLDPTSGVTQAGASVLDVLLPDPPGAPADGDDYVVASPASGAWIGHETEIATWDATASPPAWTFVAPTSGQQVWSLADSFQYTWDTTVSPPAWMQGQAAHDRDDATTWEHSANPALAALTLIRHEKALAFDDEIIPIQQYADAADSASAQLESSILSENLRLHLLFEGPDQSTNPADFVDSSEFAHTAALTAGKLSAGTGSSGSSSVRFDQVGSGGLLAYTDLEMPSPPETHARDVRPGSKEFDFSVVVNPDAIEVDQTIFATADSSTVRTYRLRILAGGALEFVGWGIEGNFDTANESALQVITITSAAGVISAGVLQTVRVWRQVDDWRISVNGAVVASDLGHAATLFTGSTDLIDFKVGYWQNQSDRFVGHMDNLRIVINQIAPPSLGTFGCNGLVVIDERELSLLDPVLGAMAGHLDTTDGLFGIRAGVWVAPTDTLPQPIGDEVSVDGARDAGFDSVVAKFISADADFTETDGGGYALRPGFRVHPLELPMVSQPGQAAQLEKIFALRAEPNRKITATWDGREGNRRVGERVNFALPGFTRADGTFVIESRALSLVKADDGGLRFETRMTLLEDLATTYDPPEGFLPPDVFAPVVPPEPGMAPPDAVSMVQTNYRASSGAAARLKVTVTLSVAVAASAQRISIQVTDGGGWLGFAVLDVDSETLVYTTTSPTFDPAIVGLTYTARARTESDTGGDSDWVVGNSVTIVAPVLDYDDADYSAEYA